MKDWIKFSFEKLEINLTEEDRKHPINYDTLCKRFLDIIPEKDSDYVSDVSNDFKKTIKSLYLLEQNIFISPILVMELSYLVIF